MSKISKIFGGSIGLNRLIFIISLFWIVFANNSFYHSLLQTYPTSTTPLGFLAAVTFGAFSLIMLLLCISCTRRTYKPILITLLISSAFVAYFMDSYNVMINVDIVRNTLMSDSREINDLMSMKLCGYVGLLGVLPALFVWKVKIVTQPFKQALFARLKLIILLFAVNLVVFLYYGAAFASFFREHHEIRYYANPANYIYAVTKVAVRGLQTTGGEIKKIGEDAHSTKHNKPKLLIVVVGETVRNDRFSLNGYVRDTNPLLRKRKVVSFTDVTSCGTSTNVSLPCMFSNLGVDNFDGAVASHTEDLLDVLQHAGVAVLWRDNNSSSKGVADRVDYVDYRFKPLNQVCDHDECRDVGMIDASLQTYIDSKTGDVLIVLHQMGNHGPAYYKRYPDEFEKFKPACKTNDLAACSADEIGNAYDNAVLYTDYFLDETIKFLQANEPKFEVAMVYVGDHGESLGENGIYLHGMPNFIAPLTQRKVPLIIWLGENYQGIKIEQLVQRKAEPLTHDNIFHTILGMMAVETKLYNPKLDILRPIKEVK
jgi:lipid A ethanolaminephosphotransferase